MAELGRDGRRERVRFELEAGGHLAELAELRRDRQRERVPREVEVAAHLDELTELVGWQGDGLVYGAVIDGQVVGIGVVGWWRGVTT